MHKKQHWNNNRVGAEGHKTTLGTVGRNCRHPPSKNAWVGTHRGPAAQGAAAPVGERVGWKPNPRRRLGIALIPTTRLHAPSPAADAGRHPPPPRPRGPTHPRTNKISTSTSVGNCRGLPTDRPACHAGARPSLGRHRAGCREQVPPHKGRPHKKTHTQAFHLARTPTPGDASWPRQRHPPSASRSQACPHWQQPRAHHAFHTPHCQNLKLARSLRPACCHATHASLPRRRNGRHPHSTATLGDRTSHNHPPLPLIP